MATEIKRAYVVAGGRDAVGGLFAICEVFETKEALAKFIVDNPQVDGETQYRVLEIYADADTGHYNDALDLTLSVDEIFPYTYVTVGYKGE